MLKKGILILSSVYFLLGNILLPQGDFSVLAQLGDMFDHCRQYEDPDINLPEFLAGHLLNMDNAPETEGDEKELPHNPMPLHTCVHVWYFVNEPQTISFKAEKPLVLNQPEYHSIYFSRLNTNTIFQPPRA